MSLVDGQGNRYGSISHREDDPNNGDNQIEIQLPHIENLEDHAWKIELVNKGAAEVEAHAWINQDDRGLSRLEEPDPFYTLGSISCGKKTIAVGAFDTTERTSLYRPFEATSAGPTRRPSKDKSPYNEEIPTSRDKPELSAPGVAIVAARAHGGVTIMSGTSMAAAHVTGRVALLFELAQRTGRGLLPIDETRRLLEIPEGPAPGPSPTAEAEESPEERPKPQATKLKRRLGRGSSNWTQPLRRLLEEIAKNDKNEPSTEVGNGGSRSRRRPVP